MEIKEMCRIAAAIPGVREVHKLRTRWFGNGILLDLHVLVDKDLTVEQGHCISEEVTAEIKRKLPKVHDVLTHLEPFECVDIREEITHLACQVPGVQGVKSLQIHCLPEGIEVVCCLLAPADLPLGEAYGQCAKVREALQASPRKIIHAIVYAEPA